MHHITHPPAINHEEHQMLAYQLWEKARHPSGKDIDFWLEAEQQLSALKEPREGPAARKSNGMPSVTNDTPKAANRAKSAPQNNARNGRKMRRSA